MDRSEKERGIKCPVKQTAGWTREATPLVREIENKGYQIFGIKSRAKSSAPVDSAVFCTATPVSSPAFSLQNPVLLSF